MSFYPFVLHEISVLIELILGHLRYLLANVPPQPNSPSDNVFEKYHTTKVLVSIMKFINNQISKASFEVVVFQDRLLSHLFYTLKDTSQSRTRVKLNRVFFPR